MATGSITLTVGGTDYALTGLDFGSAASFADVATTVQAAMVTAGLSNATVSYNSTRGGFDFDSGDAADGAVTVTDTDSTTAAALGWDSDAIYSTGVSAETVTDVIDAAAIEDNDFGSFLFIDDLTIDEVEEAAIWNDAQNVLYMFLVSVTADDAAAYYSTLSGYGGTGVTLTTDDVADEYHEQFPAELLASTNFDDDNASKNYMYQQDSRRSATVTTSTDKAAYDALRVNYFGQTQESGELLEFYQEGQLMGGSTDPLAMGVYANEMWLKSELKAQALSMFLAFEQISADNTGLAIWETYLQAVCDQAVDNGVFSTDKTLTTTQQLYITQKSGDSLAYKEVASKGYWYDSEIVSTTEDDVTTYAIEYTLIYAKRDSVDSVSGTHVLI